MDGNYCVDLRQTYLALKLKFFKCLGYESYLTKEFKRGPKRSKNGKGNGKRSRGSSSSR